MARMTQKKVLALFESVDIDIEGLISYKQIYGTNPHRFCYGVINSNGIIVSWDSTWSYFYDKSTGEVVANYFKDLPSKAIKYNKNINIKNN